MVLDPKEGMRANAGNSFKDKTKHKKIDPQVAGQTSQ
jgi:hypothetical protein